MPVWRGHSCPQPLRLPLLLPLRLPLLLPVRLPLLLPVRLPLLLPVLLPLLLPVRLLLLLYLPKPSFYPSQKSFSRRTQKSNKWESRRRIGASQPENCHPERSNRFANANQLRSRGPPTPSPAASHLLLCWFPDTRGSHQTEFPSKMRED